MEKKGNLYVLTPSDFTYAPVTVSEKEAKKYEQYVAEELAKFIGTIQFGLGFFGVKASINEEKKNQIDFYDNDNNLLHSHKIECPTNQTEVITILLNTQFRGEFTTPLGKISWASDPINEERFHNSENYRFSLTCGKYSKVISICRRNGVISSIKVQILGQEDFNIKELDVSELCREWVTFKLDDVFGPSGNHVDGKERTVIYNKSAFNMDISASMSESVGDDEERSYNSSHTSWDNIERNRITIWENKKRTEIDVPYHTMRNYVIKVLSHPRSKEVISYVETEVEREFPGMMDFIRANFNVYNEVTGLTYEEDTEFEENFNDTVLPECNLPVTEKKHLAKVKEEKQG